MENLSILSQKELKTIMWRFPWYEAAKVEACRRNMLPIGNVAHILLNGTVLRDQSLEAANNSYCADNDDVDEPLIANPITFAIEQTIDISVNSITEDKELISETLAEIYLKQGLVEKAIETYRQLNLRFPEKSVYFADRIAMIQGGL